jgi:hypothetical protein
VAHLTEGSLRRIFDDPDAKTGADALHLENCVECQTRLKAVSDDARAVSTLLAVPDVKVDVGRAFSQVSSAPAAQPKFGVRLPLGRPGSRPLILAFAAAIAALALVVTAIAQGGFSSTPTTVTPVPVTVADMQALSQLSDYGTLAWTSKPQFQVVTSVAQLTTTPAVPLPKAGPLPGVTSTNITYAAMSAAVASFTFSADKAQAAATKNGKTLPAMPKGMDGATIKITVGPAVAQIYGDLKQPATGTDITQANLPQLVIAKSVVPTVSSDTVSVADFESYLLKLPGISPELQAAISALGTDGKTLPILVPVQFAHHESITLTVGQATIPAVALGDNTGLGSGVVWINGGYVYVVAGTVKKDNVVTIANNLT